MQICNDCGHELMDCSCRESARSERQVDALVRVQTMDEKTDAFRNGCYTYKEELLVAVEFGYRQCEKGNNLEAAFKAANELLAT